MWSFMLLVLCLSSTFPVNSVKDSNENSIVELIRKNKCSLLSESLLNELSLQDLCSMPLMELNDIKIRTNYDTTPLLCSQFYQMNVKLCDLHKSTTNKTNFTLPHNEVDSKLFIKKLRKDYDNITALCNSMTKVWQPVIKSSEGDQNVILLNEYFTTIVSNQSVCQRLCNGVLDGKVTDLCSVIMWEQTLINDVISKSNPSDLQGSRTSESLLDPIPKSFENNKKEDPEKNSAKQNDPVKENVSTKTEPENGSRILPKPISELPPNISNTQERTIDVTSLQSNDELDDIDHKPFDMRQEKTETSVPNNSEKKLADPSIDSFQNHPVESVLNESPQRISDNLNDDNIDKDIKTDESVIEKSDLGDLNDKAALDFDNTLPQPIEKQQEMPVDMNTFRRDRLIENEDSHFLTYFVSMGIVCGIMYILFHNKKKILALAVEGRRGRSHSTSRRRPNTAAYSKLDSNLEEAMVSNVSQASVTHVLY